MYNLLAIVTWRLLSLQLEVGSGVDSLSRHDKNCVGWQDSRGLPQRRSTHTDASLGRQALPGCSRDEWRVSYRRVHRPADDHGSMAKLWDALFPAKYFKFRRIPGPGLADTVAQLGDHARSVEYFIASLLGRSGPCRHSGCTLD